MKVKNFCVLKNNRFCVKKNFRVLKIAKAGRNVPKMIEKRKIAKVNAPRKFLPQEGVG